MKKITICLFFIFLLNLCYPYNICSGNEFDNNVRVYEKNSFFLSPIIYMKEKLLELILKDYIKKNTGIDTEVSITLDKDSSDKIYYVNNLTVTSSKPQYSCFQLTDVKLNSINARNEIRRNDKELLFPYEVPLWFSAKITNENLEFLTTSDEFKSLLAQALASYSKYIHINDISVQVVNDKIRIFVFAKLPLIFGMNVKITVYPVITVHDGQLYLEKIHYDKTATNYLNKILPSFSSPQPLSNYITALQNVGVPYKISNFSIDNNEIYFDGIFIIPANCDITE